MEGKFDVTLDGKKVGTAEVRREGLYCRISCRCRMVDGEIHRLYAGSEKIGVLIPENGVMTLESKVTAKRLKDGCGFTLGECRGRFYPICPGEAFGHLDKLRMGCLAFQDGQPGLSFSQNL